MSTASIHPFTLACGLRVIFEHTASPVVHCGYIIGAGTRHEAADDSGMAHFIEHMSFKGTRRRRACHITNGLERVGGDLNAYTNKQETVYYAAVLRNDFRRAADLLTDIVFHSTYPQHEIDREVEVICDEIDSYQDSPAEIIFDEYEALLFADHPLGRDILGRAERLRSYTTADARRFVDAYYLPSNATFFVRGDLEPRRLQATMEALWRDAPAARPTTPAVTAPTAPRRAIERRTHRDTHQAHVIMGTTTFGGNDPRRYGMLLLNNILGGPGMNSRLNMSLRERAGLVYAVDASLTTYVDAGWWSVYFGCDGADVERCRRRVVRELRRFIDTPLTAAQLAAAKKQLCGQIGIAAEAAENRALALGKDFAHYHTLHDPQRLCQRLQEVTADHLQEIAAEVYNPDTLTTLIYY
jgi:predicted Zn-dependent peptidase